MPRTRLITLGWLAFWVWLLLPSTLTALSASASDAWQFFTFKLSGATALYCGFWMAFKFGRGVASPMASRIVIGLLLSLVFYLLSVALCCAGCVIAAVPIR